MRFQYPLSDRGWCNRQPGPPGRPGGPVSVSSIGSRVVQQRGGHPAADLAAEVFQYPLSDRGWCNEPDPPAANAAKTTSFSILYRIEGGATLAGGLGTSSCDDGFSILYRIEGGATYAARWLAKCFTCFSILYRIEGGATVPTAKPLPRPPRFQYPLSDRGWCN